MYKTNLVLHIKSLIPLNGGIVSTDVVSLQHSKTCFYGIIMIRGKNRFTRFLQWLTSSVHKQPAPQLPAIASCLTEHMIACSTIKYPSFSLSRVRRCKPDTVSNTVNVNSWGRCRTEHIVYDSLNQY